MSDVAEKTQLNCRVDSNLKRAIKSKLALNGQSFVAWLEDAMKQSIASDKTPCRMHVVLDDLQDGK